MAGTALLLLGVALCIVPTWSSRADFPVSPSIGRVRARKGVTLDSVYRGRYGKADNNHGSPTLAPPSPDYIVQNYGVIGVGGSGGQCCSTVPDQQTMQILGFLEKTQLKLHDKTDFALNHNSSVVCADIDQYCCNKQAPRTILECVRDQGHPTKAWIDLLMLQTLQFTWRDPRAFLELSWAD